MTTIPLKKRIEVGLPVMPNFLHTVATKNEDSRLIRIDDLSDAELKQIGKAWTRGLLKHAQSKRKVRLKI